jgi:hypothetical protein
MLLAGLVAGCGDDATPSTPTPTVPVTDTFTGTIAQNGARIHDFAVAPGGAVTATLRSIGTDNTLVVGYSLGTWNAAASSCSIVLANETATGGAVLTGTMSALGTLCVRIADVGNIAAGTTAAYSIEVVHP